MLSPNVSAARNYCLTPGTFTADVVYQILGEDYVTPPDVAVSGGTPDTPAVIEASVVNGQIVLTIVDGGTGYDSAPTLVIGGVDDGGGSGATATTTLTGGVVTSTTITNAGGKSIKITDATAYDADTVASNLNWILNDKYGNRAEGQLTGLDDTISLAGVGLNDNKGIDAEVTVVATVSGEIVAKNGSAHDLVSIYEHGHFDMQL